MKFTYRNQEVNFPDELSEENKKYYHRGTFYEIDFLEYIDSLRLKGTYVDAGCHIGNHAIYFANFCRSEKVYTFEPLKYFHAIARENILHNTISNGKCELFNFGLGDTEGSAEFSFQGVKETIILKRMDDVLSHVNNVCVIKIDVEGSEVAVINGGKKLIERCKPVIFAEAHNEEEYLLIRNSLANMGYIATGNVFNATPTYEFVHTDKGHKRYFDVGSYWDDRYHQGKTSGAGSYNRLAHFKASFLNKFVKKNKIKSVVELGCGDGGQLSLAEYPAYIGLDISQKAIEICGKRFHNDGSKKFAVYNPESFNVDQFRSELALSLDVIYHLSNDETYKSYLDHLFSLGNKYVVIYSNSTDLYHFGVNERSEYVRFRDVIDDIKQIVPDWGLVAAVPNNYPFNLSLPNDTSFADFFVFKHNPSKHEIIKINSDFFSRKAVNQLVSNAEQGNLLSQQLKSQQKTLDGLQKLLNDATKKIPSLESRVSVLVLENSHLQEKISQLQNEEQSLRKNLKTTEAARDHFQWELGNAETERNNLQIELENAEAERNNLQIELENAETERNNLQIELENAEAERNNLQLELENAEAERNMIQFELKKEITELGQRYREANKTLDTLKQRLAEANEKYRLATGQQIPALKERLQAETARAHSLREQSKHLTDQLNTETKKRIAAEQRIVQLRSSLTFKLGYLIRNARGSWLRMAKLPVGIWRLYRQARKRAQLQQNRLKTQDGKIKAPLFAPASKTEPFQPPQPRIPEQEAPSTGSKPAPATPANRLRVACIMDDFTFASYNPECELHQLTPADWQKELEDFRPELLFIESAWRGKDELWGSKVGHKSTEVQNIVAWCRERNIPTVFWNKEDPVHYGTFLNTAKLFDYVFTTDLDCIARYKAALGHDRVYLLPFACQPAMHNPIEKYRRKDAFCFAGAYYVRYPERTRDLESFVSELPKFRPLEIYDRNYGKDDPSYQFPQDYQPYIVGTLPFAEIDKAYKGYKYAINLNSIKQSQTMFARRVFELLGSGTITISNFSRGLRLMFGDLVLTSDSGQEILTRLDQLASEPEKADKFRLAGLRKVMLEHTYQQRLNYVIAKVGGSNKVPNTLPPMVVLAAAANQEQADNIIEMFQAQTQEPKRLVLQCHPAIKIETTANVERLSLEQTAGLKVGEVADDGVWVAGMSADDYYGPNYLLDLALATRYAGANLVGKSAHYQAEDAGIGLQQGQESFIPVKTLAARRAAIKANLVADENLADWLQAIPAGQLASEQCLAIDPFNYCCLARRQPLTEIQAVVDDLPGLDHGLGIGHLQKAAEDIPPAAGNESDETMLGPEQLSALFGPCNSAKITIQSTDTGLLLNSRLKDGKHEYLYAVEDLELTALAQDGLLKCYFDTGPGLAVSLTVLFLDAEKQRISHVIFQANRNCTAEIPVETAWLRLGLRVYSGGEGEIKGIVAGHHDLDPAKLLPRADCLLLTNHYPSYDDLYRNGFVHSRVKGYQERGVKVDVFRLRKNEPVSYHEFQNVDVTTGSQEALRRLLAGHNYQSILVHFLDPDMWEVLKGFVDRTRIIVWVHGAEIQPWWRREYNYENDEQHAAGKLQSEQRMLFWRTFLASMPKNLLLVFVSRYFADEVMEDLGFRLPESKYEIIHNPIDTNLFSYHQKNADQRKKILSIRPFASAKYANDLSVKAIKSLSHQPFFNELDIRIIGEGRLFDEILDPIKRYGNVKIERRFLKQNEIATLHKDYGIFLCPTRMDAQGVSRDEAMASGLVPVTNSVAAIPEFVDEKCGILAQPDDAQGLADGIAKLYHSPELFIAMSKSAAENVQLNRGCQKVMEKELKLIIPVMA